MFIKICGIKTIEDAVLASSLGADAIGMLVGQRFPSEDFISAEKAANIASKIPANVLPVIVTHFNKEEEILTLLEKTSINCIQLHAEVSQELVKNLKQKNVFLRVFKCIHVTQGDCLQHALKWDGLVDAIVLDSKNEESGQIGGTGVTHDWSISKEIVQKTNTHVILAGGLSPENVTTAIKTVKPFGVDANSALQNHKGFKDKEKIKSFISEIKLFE